MSKPISVQLYRPHQNQEKIHWSIKNEPYKYYVLDIGRQFGKTLLAENQAMDWAFNQPGCKIAWVSPIYKQAKKVFEEIDLAFAHASFVFSEKNKTDLTFKFCTGSTMQFFSAERYDNIRGFTFDYLICDEFAFMDAEAWTEVLRATVLVRGKKVLLISTPKGKNHFWQLHSLDGIDKQYKSFKMTSYDNPIIDPSEIDAAKETLPDHVFRQEYMAEFIDGGTGVFLNLNIQSAERTDKNYFGVDIGRADDYTVLSIFNKEGKQIYIERWRHDTWVNISRKVAEKINEYNAVGYVEVNSVGDAIFEQIRTLCRNQNNVHPFITTAKSKQDIIEQIAVANMNKEISFLNCDWLIKEFDVFTFEFNAKSRTVRYAAPSGFHDDGVMGSAIGYEAFKKLKHSGQYFIS